MDEMIIEQVKQFDGKYTGAMGGLFDLNEPAKQILGELDAGHVFIYMFRRFGYPRHGWDNQKEVVKYYLTTSMDGVVLVVHPDVTGAGTFGYLLSEDMDKLSYAEEIAPYNEWWARCEAWAQREHKTEIIKMFEPDDAKLQRVYKKWGADKEDNEFQSLEDVHKTFIADQEDIRIKCTTKFKEIETFPQQVHIRDMDDSSIKKQCHNALCDTIEDLKRPVYIRDVMVNICGKFEYNGEWYDVAHSNMAGVGVGDKFDTI